MAQIRHIAIFSDNPEKLGQFYIDTFGMKSLGKVGTAFWFTDGHLNVALLQARDETHPKGRTKKGIDHFGFTLDAAENEAVYSKLKALGIEPFDPRGGADDGRPYVELAARDTEGNRYDLTTGMREIRPAASAIPAATTTEA